MSGPGPPDRLAHLAANRPDDVALRVDGGATLSYGTWHRRADALARGLAQWRVAPGDRVVLRFARDRWPDHAVAHVGVHRVGGVPVPVGADLPDLELARIVHDCRPVLLVTPDGPVPARVAVRVTDPRELEESSGAGAPPVDARPSDLSEVLHRSRPLSLPVSWSRRLEEVADGPMATFGPLAGCAAFVHGFPVGTAAGQDALYAALRPTPARSLVVPIDDPERLCALLAVTPGAVLGLHPAVAAALLDTGALGRHDLSSVAGVVLAGGSVPGDLPARLAAALPGAAQLLVDHAEPTNPRLPADGPVAASQEGMLWHEVFAPGCQNLPGLARRYRGPLDVDALRRALDEIVRRHAPLRSTFAHADGQLVQVVHPHRGLALPVHDLGHLPGADREAHAERLVTDAGRAPFDLVTGPVFEPTLLRLADDDHVLLLRTHHSVFDDWSVGVFRGELVSLYTAFTAGAAASPPPALPVTFPEAARDQRARLADRDGARELAFWRRELAGAPWTTQLPVDDPERRQGSPQATGRPITVGLPDTLRADLQALARRERATVFMVLLTAFGVLVQRVTGQDDLLLATVVANRNRTEVEGLVGCFTKKVPLRLRLGGDPTFLEALARTRTAVLGALTHQDLPFETVVQDVLGASAAAHGLVPHLAVMFQGVTPGQELHLPGLDTEGFETSTRVARAHFMAEDDDRPGGDVEDAARREPTWGAGLYRGTFLILSVDATDTALSCTARGAFHAPAVEDLLARFRTLLGDVVVDPSRPVRELAVLDREAEADVLKKGRGPTVPVPDDPLELPVGAATDSVDVVRSGTGTVTGAALADRVEGLAARLRELGIGPGGLVGIALPASVDAVVAALATWRIGAAWVGLDADEAADHLRRVVTDAGVAVIVGDDPRGVLDGHVPVVPARTAGAAGSTPTVPPTPTEPGGDAVVVHGTGPTAPPHAVLDRRAVGNLRLGLRTLVPPAGASAPRRRVCLSAPPTDDGFLRQLLALLDGHTLHVAPAVVADAPAEAVALVRDGLVDRLDLAPDDLDELVGAGLTEALRGRGGDDGDLLLVVGARGPVSPERFEVLRSLPGARAHLLFGTPACGPAVTARSVADGSRRAHVGRPLPNVACHVLDPRGRPVPSGALGELHVGGPGVARRGEPGGPRASTDDPTGQGRSVPTGQLARSLADGAVELLGDTTVDLRGFRIDLDRLREALATCPGVADVTVATERDDDGIPRLAAAVTPGADPPTAGELRRWLWTRLPGHARPAVVAGLPDAAGDASCVTSSLPGGALRALWAQLAGHDVPTDANFWQDVDFLEVLGRARDAGLSVPGGAVTRNRTLATLADDLAVNIGRPAQR